MQTNWLHAVDDHIMTRTKDGAESLKVLQRVIIDGRRAYRMEYGYTLYEDRLLDNQNLNNRLRTQFS
jgi:hypothetical protein